MRKFAVKSFAGQPEDPNYLSFLSTVAGIYFKVGCDYATKTDYVRQYRLCLGYGLGTRKTSIPENLYPFLSGTLRMICVGKDYRFHSKTVVKLISHLQLVCRGWDDLPGRPRCRSI